MNTIASLLFSPIGPSLFLFAGTLLLLAFGRRVQRPGALTGLALAIVAIASLLWLQLRLQPVLPIYSQPWRPLLQAGANWVWVGDGWNWYVSGLILLLNALGILVDWGDLTPKHEARAYRQHSALAVHLAVLSASLLFVGSGNLLTTILTWVLLDLFLLMRAHPDANASLGVTGMLFQDNSAKGLSLFGALLLLIGLLPAGPGGPGQSLQDGILPQETVIVLLVAAFLRAGIYPLHLWLLPNRGNDVNLSERLLEQIVPTLCGLWLLGWAIRLGGGVLLLQPEITALLMLLFVFSAFTAFTAAEQASHKTFVLITAALFAVLSGVFGQARDPSAVLWATTAYALGGGLWLIGEAVWSTWGWQIPISVGALTLVGIPFTPGFLAQGSLARMLTLGAPFIWLFLLYVLGQMLQVASLLRSWSGEGRSESNTPLIIMWRLLAACVALGLPLAITGILPTTAAMIAGLPGSIPTLLGSPPNVVAELPVWVMVGMPLLLGIALVWTRLWIPERVLGWLSLVGEMLRLEWLLRFVWWGMNNLSEIWGNAVRVVEGAGSLGWLLVFVLIGYLLGQ